MTVRFLISELEKIEDKDLDVVIPSEHYWANDLADEVASAEISDERYWKDSECARRKCVLIFA